MAEFAVVLPVLALVVLAIMQFGVLLNNYLTVTDAVRAGARTAAVSRKAADPAGVTYAKVQASAVNLDQSQFSTNLSSSGCNVSLCAHVTTTWLPGADVTVTATYPCKLNLLAGFGFTCGKLTSTVVERVE